MFGENDFWEKYSSLFLPLGGGKQSTPRTRALIAFLRPGPYVGRSVKKIGEIARHRTPQISPIWLDVRTAVKFTCEILL
jgi:hypothetical protein